jgi:general secretion pathway protein I
MLRLTQMQPALPRGFSLLEVLIALAVISIAVLALSQSGGQAPRHYQQLQTQAEALWVAENVVTGLRIDERFPVIGTRSGSQRMGLREWRWQAEIQATADADIRRAEVSVFSTSLDQPAATHTAYFGRN